jgi:ATP synthase protein I
MRRLVRSVPGKIFVGQAAVTFAAALVALATIGAEGALGALVGGGISLVLTAWTAVRVFSVRPDAGPQAMFSAFARAEAMKIVMAVVLFRPQLFF